MANKPTDTIARLQLAEQGGSPADTHIGVPAAAEHGTAMPMILTIKPDADLPASESGSSEPDDHHHLFPRHGDKYKATWHNVTAMLGAGVLGLPSTFTYLGWTGGIICLCGFLAISWYTFVLLVKMHEAPPKQAGGRIQRFDTYNDLGQYVLGPKRGWWAVVPFQTMLLYGMGVTYTVTGATNLQSVAQLQGAGSAIERVSYWVLIFSGVELLLCLVPNFSELGWISMIGAIMSALYSVMATVLSGTTTPAPDVNYQPGEPAGKDSIEQFFGIFTALSTVAFAYGGHNLALEIQATLPAKANESTYKPMMFSVHTAFVMTGAAYFAVAISGFYAFGTAVPSNILDAMTDPNGAITAAHLAVVLHVLASYQVYSFPLFDSMELTALRRWPQLEHQPWRRFGTRTALRWAYVCSTAFIACLIPFFGDLMNLIGAVAITPTTFVLPCVLWIYWAKPGVRTASFWAAMGVAVIMTAVGVLGAISAVRSIVLDASTYKPFS